MPANLYETLGVDQQASAADIKGAFRKHAKTAHPDAGGSAEAFAEVNRAYLVLSDPARRDKYDRTGDAGDAAADNSHVEALTIIQQMMDQIVEHLGDRFEVDIVARMRESMDDKLAEIRRDVVMRRSKVTTLQRLAAKFRKESGENVLRKMVEAKVRGLEASIAGAERAIASMTKAREMLEGYQFDVDPVQQRVYVMHTMSPGTMWAGSTGTAG